MNIGIIGTGNMGTILTEAFIDGEAVSPASLVITNRTISKAITLQNKYQSIEVVTNETAVVEKAKLVFICVKPLDIYALLQKIAPNLTEEHCIVSITSPINVEQLQSVVSCSVARAIPSITNRALGGVSLLTFHKNCSTFWKEKLIELFSRISTPVEIDDQITRVASDIVSCGPALYSYLTQRFISAAVNETKIDEQTATTLAAEMLIGLGELLKKGCYTLPTLQAKVCVKDGITGEAIKVLEKEVGELFEHVFQATHAKFQEDLEKIAKQFQ